MSLAQLETLVSRLENVALRLENNLPSSKDISPPTQSPDMEPDILTPTVMKYDAILTGPLATYRQLSATVGMEVKTQADLVTEAFQAQRLFLITASKSSQPDQNTLMNLLKPTSDKIQAIQEYRQKSRASSLFNHLSAISESIPALGWVAVSPTPAPYVKEMLDAGQFYTNRVLVDYKDKDKLHVDWAKSWIQVLTQLQSYVKQDHTTGLVWGGGPTAAPGLPPPPPPPPPADLFQDSGAGDDDRAALFKQINQGGDITRGLRKVTADQQTHKNPALRTSGPAPGSKPSAPLATLPKPAVAKPPKLELEGKKWRVENHVDRRDIVIDGTEMNQVVNIYQCQNCVVQVKGKINSIVVDSCKKTAIVFDDIVSTVEFINCKSIQAQSMGTVPTVTVDKAESVLIYLSPRSLDCEVVTSMSFEVNVAIPKGDGDFAEHSIPEQFKSIWTGKVLKTVPIEKN